MPRRGLIAFTIFTAFGLALLVGLGLWQLERKGWKDALLAQIAARTTAPPVSLEEALKLARSGEDVGYLRVRVDGQFDHAKERYLYALGQGEIGWHVITPLITEDGDIVLVDRGFVPDARKEPSARKEGQVEGTVSVTGLLRKSEAEGLFTPNNDPEQNRWFSRDLRSMTQSMFAEAEEERVAPFFLEAEEAEVPGGLPRGGQTRLDLPNNHLQYAVTWFSLAICLLVLYLFYLRNAWRGE